MSNLDYFRKKHRVQKGSDLAKPKVCHVMTSAIRLKCEPKSQATAFHIKPEKLDVVNRSFDVYCVHLMHESHPCDLIVSNTGTVSVIAPHATRHAWLESSFGQRYVRYFCFCPLQMPATTCDLISISQLQSFILTIQTNNLGSRSHPSLPFQIVIFRFQ